jgi:hypothetical protein
VDVTIAWAALRVVHDGNGIGAPDKRTCGLSNASGWAEHLWRGFRFTTS